MLSSTAAFNSHCVYLVCENKAIFKYRIVPYISWMYSAPLRSVQALDRLQICLTWAFVFDVYFYLHYRFYLCVHKFSICGYVRNGLKAAEHCISKTLRIEIYKQMLCKQNIYLSNAWNISNCMSEIESGIASQQAIFRCNERTSKRNLAVENYSYKNKLKSSCLFNV